MTKMDLSQPPLERWREQAENSDTQPAMLTELRKTSPESVIGLVKRKEMLRKVALAFFGFEPQYASNKNPQP
jgi:hypothetical protein